MQTVTGLNQNASRASRWFCASLLLSVCLSPLTQPEFRACPRSAGGAVVNIPVTLHRPLISLECSATLLNVSRDKAFELIESGDLLFAFDLSAKKGCRHPLIRVLSQSVADYLAARPAPKDLPDVQTVIGQQIFPGHGAGITAFGVSRQWSVDSDHVLNLWRAGELRLASGGKCRPGRNGSPRLDFGSVAEFMTERQLL